jgi:hypothetical protein
MLVRGEPPEGAQQFEAAELQIVAPDGRAVTLAASVVQVFPGVGVAVAFEPKELAALAPLVEAARAAGDEEGGEPVCSLGGAPPADAGQAARPPKVKAGSDTADVQRRLAAMTSQEKVQIALKGSRDERSAILRDVNKTVHVHVLKNPNLQLDEVVAMAKMTTISPDALAAIAARREWAGRPEIAQALVRNPKTPVPTAIKLLDSLSLSDLRLVAKDPHTRAPIQAAARKKIIA